MASTELEVNGNVRASVSKLWQVERSIATG